MRAILDRVVVRERSDLDPDTASLFMPDTAKKFSPSVEPDHLCYAEVVSIGRGSIEQPTIAELREGDVVMFDLANVDHAYIEDGAGYQVMSQKALAAVARVEKRLSRALPGQPGHGELVDTVVGFDALLDWVITVQDADEMAGAISKLIRAPDSILTDGQRTDQMQDGNMRLVYDRVVSAGKGRRYAIKELPRNDVKRLAYDDVRAPDRWIEKLSIPEVKEGELVAYSPSAATRFRFDGKFYRAVPYDEMHGVVQEKRTRRNHLREVSARVG